MRGLPNAKGSLFEDERDLVDVAERGVWLDPSTGEREGNGEKDGGSVLSNVGCGVYG